MNILKTLLWAFSVTVILQSCYPGGPQYVEDYDVTYARQNPNYKFEDNKDKITYVMPDTIVDITDPDEVNDPPEIPESTERMILDQVRMRMGDYGYTLLDDSEVDNADYVVLCQRLVTDNYVTYFWGGWGCWYPGWCWGGYYPPVSTTYNYRTGTLYVTMGAMELSTPDTLEIIWDAGVNGLLGTSTSVTQARINDGINNMFDLSPYLNKN